MGMSEGRLGNLSRPYGTSDIFNGFPAINRWAIVSHP